MSKLAFFLIVFLIIYNAIDVMNPGIFELSFANCYATLWRLEKGESKIIAAID